LGGVGRDGGGGSKEGAGHGGVRGAYSMRWGTRGGRQGRPGGGGGGAKQTARGKRWGNRWGGGRGVGGVSGGGVRFDAGPGEPRGDGRVGGMMRWEVKRRGGGRGGLWNAEGGEGKKRGGV